MTNEEIVSLIMNRFRALTQDKRLSRRYVLAEAVNTVKTYIEQRVGDRPMDLHSLFEVIECLEMEKIDSVKCPVVEFKRCGILMRSKERLPKLLYTKYGPLVSEVTNITGDLEFKPSSLRSYKVNKRKTPLRNSSKNFYYVKDGYLYIPDIEIYSVNLLAVSLDSYGKMSASSCGDKCQSLWEMEFKIPEKLGLSIVDKVTEAISINRQIPIDPNPNLNEEA